MKASELVARIQELIAAKGDLNVFIGEMVPLEADNVEVFIYYEDGTGLEDGELCLYLKDPTPFIV